MTDTNTKIPPSIKKWLDTKMIIILGVVAKMIWDTFQVGAEVKYQEHFRETLQTEKSIDIVDTRVAMGIDVAMDDAQLWKKAFGNDQLLDFVSEKVDEGKQFVIDEVISADSSKIDFIGGLGVGSGLRNEAIMPILVKIIKAIDKGDLMFKDDVEEYIDREVKKQTTRVVRANF